MADRWDWLDMRPAQAIQMATFASVVSGDGVAGGRGAVVQIKDPTVADPSGFDNVTGDQTVTMDANFTVGSAVIFDAAHYQTASIDIGSVTIAGTAATRRYTSGAGNTQLQSWQLGAVVNAGRADIVIHFVSGGGHYMSCGAVELSGPVAYVATVSNSSNSQTPNATSGTPNQCEHFYTAFWRDATGINSTSPSPIPAGWTREFYVANGLLYLGGAGACKQGPQRIATTTATFAVSSNASWVCAINQWNWTLPLVNVGTSVQFWSTSDAWAPTTQSRAVSATTKLLVTVGGWWDGNGTPSAVPTDNNGTFTAALNPTISGESPTTPVVTQVCYQSSPTVATHVVTPPVVQSGGDGYFTLLEIDGIDGSTPIRDKGRNRAWHAPVTPPDSNTIQSMTVATDGALAQVGDTCVAVFIMDPNSTSNSDIAWVPPSGWFVLENKFNATDNVGYLVCCAVVTTAGKITATATWTDPNTFVADASIVVFKKA